MEAFVSIYQTGAIFFILAYGMLLPWRVAMYAQYRKLSH
ncbi:CcdC protein domain-containing protein [Paenibacillus sedimenti]|nr:CcdC protein domain-containing protein [Paenibacillus sedimenti]